MNSLRFIAFTALLLPGLLGLPVHAQYHLDKVAEFQLPPNDCRDVQHWTSDSTYGWVTAEDDTITYCLNVDAGSVQSFSFDMVDNFYCGDMIGWPLYLRIFGSEPPLPRTVVLIFYCGSPNDAHDIITRIDVESGEEIPSRFQSLNWFDTGTGSYTWTINSLHVWPPPPSSISSLTIARTSVGGHDGAGSDSYWEDSEGKRFQLDADSLVSNLGQVSRISYFAEWDSLALGGLGHYYSQTISGPIPPYSVATRAWDVRKLIFSSQVYVDTICSVDTSWVGRQSCTTINSVAAQQSLDGSRRVFYGDSICYLIEGDLFVPVWYEPAIRGTQITATVQDSTDERLLVHRNGNWFDIYDAAFGNHIGCTSSFQGTYQYTLKQPNRVTEFVTYHPQSRTIRIYRPVLGSVGLVLNYLPESDELQLTWSNFSCASGYRIWYDLNGAMTEPNLIATTTDTTYTFSLPENDLGFFKVEMIP